MPHLNLTFTDTNETTLVTHDANWIPYSGVADGDVEIFDNSIRRYSGSDGRYTYDTQLGVTSFAVEWSHKLTTIGGRAGVLVNPTAAGTMNGYLFRSHANSNAWQLYKINNGSFSLVDSATFTFTQNTTYSCRVERDAANNTIVCKVDGQTLCETTDADYKNNDRIGIRMSDGANVYIDNIVTSDLAAPGPSISNVDGDNAVNQYQMVNIIVTDFTETITSVTINGVSVDSIPDNDPADDVIQVRMPGSLTTGTYDVVVSGATETDTITGVSYTQTHGRPAFDGLVDSNSILNGQSYTADSYFRFTGSFTNGTLDVSAGDAREWQDDIQDYYTPDSGFTGDDTNGIEFLYSDGTTSATVPVTLTVEEAASGYTVVKSGTSTNSLWGSIGMPEGALVSLIDDDSGSVTLNADGELVGFKDSSVATLDVDGTSVRVFVRPAGVPVKPFCKLNWKVIE